MPDTPQPDTPQDDKMDRSEPRPEDALRSGGTEPGRAGEDRSFAGTTEPGRTGAQGEGGGSMSGRGQEDAGDPAGAEAEDAAHARAPGASSQVGGGPGGLANPLQTGGMTPGGGPGAATQGAIGTGGGSTGGEATGDVKRGGG